MTRSKPITAADLIEILSQYPAVTPLSCRRHDLHASDIREEKCDIYTGETDENGNDVFAVGVALAIGPRF